MNCTEGKRNSHVLTIAPDTTQTQYVISTWVGKGSVIHWGSWNIHASDERATTATGNWRASGLDQVLHLRLLQWSNASLLNYASHQQRGCWLCWFSRSKGQMSRKASGMKWSDPNRNSQDPLLIIGIRTLLGIQTQTKKLDISGKRTGNQEAQNILLLTGLWERNKNNAKFFTGMLTLTKLIILFLLLFPHLPSQLLQLPLIKKSPHRHVLKGWFYMATASQGTGIRTLSRRFPRLEKLQPLTGWHLTRPWPSEDKWGPPELERINVTQAQLCWMKSKNTPNRLYFMILGQLVLSTSSPEAGQTAAGGPASISPQKAQQLKRSWIL